MQTPMNFWITDEMVKNFVDKQNLIERGEIVAVSCEQCGCVVTLKEKDSEKQVSLDLSKEWRSFMLETYKDKYAKELISWCDEMIEQEKGFYERSAAESYDEIIAQREQCEKQIAKFTAMKNEAISYLNSHADEPDAE